MCQDMKTTDMSSSAESQKNVEQISMKKDKLLFGKCCTC